MCAEEGRAFSEMVKNHKVITNLYNPLWISFPLRIEMCSALMTLPLGDVLFTCTMICVCSVCSHDPQSVCFGTFLSSVSSAEVFEEARGHGVAATCHCFVYKSGYVFFLNKQSDMGYISPSVLDQMN